MRPQPFRRVAKVAAVLAVTLLSTLASAKDDVIIGGKVYEELERNLLLKDGEMMLKVRLKSPTAPSAAAPTVKVETAAVSVTAVNVSTTRAKETLVAAKDAPANSALKSAAVGLLPKLDNDFSDILAKEAKPTDSPGLTALGVTAGDLNQPVTPKDLGVILARGLDASGKVKEGIAVQLSPAVLFFPDSIVGGLTYENDKLMQAYTRTSLELATSKSEDARIGQQLAASVTVGLIDGSDPRLFWAPLDDCARKAMRPVGVPPKPPQMMSAEELSAWNLIQEKAITEAKDCYTAYQAAEEKIGGMWAKPRWYAGYAKAWSTGPSSKIADSHSGPSMLWTSFSKGINKPDAPTRALFQLAASKKWHSQVEDPLDATKLTFEDRSDLIMRLRFSRARWSAFVDAGVARVNTAGDLSSNVKRFGYGAEYQLNETLWLVLGSVTERGFTSGDKRTLLNTGLRFGQSDKPVFGPVGK